MSDHLARMWSRTDAAAAIAKAHRAAANHRTAPVAEWLERERMAIALEANKWAGQCGWRKVTVADVERIEHKAIGHSDYVEKLALHVVELMCDDT